MLSATSRRFIGAIAMVATLAPSAAGAAPPDAPRRDPLATARDLFVQAEHDEDAGLWQDALDTLRQVALVKLTAGVRYHIALCEEHLDMLVNALDDFTAAKAQAVIERAEDVLRLVDNELETLGPRVPRLAIHLTPEDPEATVTLDGADLDLARIGESRALNPGVHRIEAHAPGGRTASVTVTMRERDATALEIAIPPLPPPGPPPAPKAAPRTERVANPRDEAPVRVETLAAALVAVAFAGGGLGAYVAAGRAHDHAVSSCAVVTDRSSDPCEAQKNMVRAWDWAAAGGWAGAAIATGFAVYWGTRPARDHGASSLSWGIGVGSVGVRGTF
jgi:hypothetical protein